MNWLRIHPISPHQMPIDLKTVQIYTSTMETISIFPQLGTTIGSYYATKRQSTYQLQTITTTETTPPSWVQYLPNSLHREIYLNCPTLSTDICSSANGNTKICNMLCILAYYPLHNQLPCPRARNDINVIEFLLLWLTSCRTRKHVHMHYLPNATPYNVPSLCLYHRHGCNLNFQETIVT